MTRRLNLGCGYDVRPGHVNLDAVALPGVDVVHDLAAGALPFPDGSFDLVVARDVLEHLDYLPVVREVHRVLRPGGRLEISGPHFTARDRHLDPTHRHGFSVGTFGFFVAGHPRSYAVGVGFRVMPRARIGFHRYRGQPWNYLLERVVNRSPGVQAYYEDTGWSRLFPASHVEVTLVK